MTGHFAWAQLTRQDADFVAEEEPKKKKRKDRKGKNKLEREPEAMPEEEGLTVQEKAAKVKDAMEEYRKLDHEDMVCSDRLLLC